MCTGIFWQITVALVACQRQRKKNRINLLFSAQIGFYSIDLLKTILTLIILCFHGASGQVENTFKGQVKLRYNSFTCIYILFVYKIWLRYSPAI